MTLVKTYIYLSCIALKYLATLRWNILLTLGNVGLSTFWWWSHISKALRYDAKCECHCVLGRPFYGSLWKKRILAFAFHKDISGSCWKVPQCRRLFGLMPLALQGWGWQPSQHDVMGILGLWHLACPDAAPGMPQQSSCCDSSSRAGGDQYTVCGGAAHPGALAGTGLLSKEGK